MWHWKWSKGKNSESAEEKLLEKEGEIEIIKYSVDEDSFSDETNYIWKMALQSY